MNKGLHSVDMAEGPLVDEFMRHLQASLDEAMDIEDKLERHERILQLEIAIQEAIIFKNRYNELVSHGIDPLVLVSQRWTRSTTSCNKVTSSYPWHDYLSKMWSCTGQRS